MKVVVAVVVRVVDGVVVVVVAVEVGVVVKESLSCQGFISRLVMILISKKPFHLGSNSSILLCIKPYFIMLKFCNLKICSIVHNILKYSTLKAVHCFIFQTQNKLLVYWRTGLDRKQ